MRYEAPNSLDQAVALLVKESGDARVLAGGTDLLVQMRTDVLDPVLVVDIKGIAEMRQIKEEAGGFRIGAAVTGAELKEHPKLKSVWPGLVEAANLIGSTQVQGRATMGGNLCNGSPAADSVPALIAAGAKATIVGPKGRRDVPVEDVMLAPRKLSLTKGEIIASFLLPAKAARTGDAYLRFIPRTEMDIAVVGVRRVPHAGRQGHLHGGARLAGRGGRAAAAGRAGRGRPDRQHGRRGRVAEARRRGERRLPADRRQARHQGISHQGRGRSRPPGRTDCARTGEEGLMAKHHVTATVNGDAVEFLCETQETLLDVLRDQLGLTGTKEGCSTGDCGACSVTVDGRLVCSCLMLGVEASGKSIGTIEGVARGDELHPLQRKFLEHAALQCGICTPGFLVAAKALLEKQPNPTETEVRYWLAGNLCRCTGYDKIVRAVLDAATEMRGA